MTNVEAEQAATRLNELLQEGGFGPLSRQQAQCFGSYLSLLLRWNAKTNLTAVRDPEEILSRHFVECIVCARLLPSGISSLLDLGSGAGFPGIPIALCRPAIKVTLAESQGKKATFLREAVRTLELAAEVRGGRAEQFERKFDCVILRAVDKMAEAVGTAVTLVAPAGWLALMTTQADLVELQQAAGTMFSWEESSPLPGGVSRILAMGHYHRAGFYRP